MNARAVTPKTTKSSFFLPDISSDELYVIIRDGSHPRCEEARTLVERLWPLCSPYLDHDFRRQAADRFETRFWEMYLAWTLLENGVTLKQRPVGRRVAGPDFQTESRDVWIEAVLATAGTGENAVPDLVDGGVRSVPEAEMILRLRTAIETKVQKGREYLTAGVVMPDEPFVIAVGARRIPLGRLESPIPRVVAAVFPFGNAVVHFDRDSGDVVGESYEYRPEILNARKSPVRTDLFLDPSYSHVSGVLYAGVDEVNRPQVPGPEFLFVHNPLAAVPLPAGYFPFGVEYWKEADRLQSRRLGNR